MDGLSPLRLAVCLSVHLSFLGTSITMMGNMTARLWGGQLPPLGWVDKWMWSAPLACPPPPIPSRPTQHSSGTMLQEALRPTHFPWGEVLLTSLLVPWGGHGMRVGGSLPAPGVWGRSLATAPGSAIVFLALALLPFSSSSASCSGGVGPALALLPARLLAAVGGSARGAQRGVPVPPPLQLCPSQVPALRWYVLIRSPVPSSEPRQRLWGAK